MALLLYVYVSARCRNIGRNRDVSRPGRLCYISAKSTPALCRERIYPFRFFNSALALLLYVYCGSPVRNIGRNRNVSQPGRLFCISAKSASAPCRERIYPFRFFRGALTHLPIRISLVARFGTMAETVAFRSPGESSILVQKFSLHLVGNRFACSVHYGFLRTIRSGYRNKCISISVKALLKSAPAQLFSAAFHAFCGCGGRGAG